MAYIIFLDGKKIKKKKKKNSKKRNEPEHTDAENQLKTNFQNVFQRLVRSHLM
jgi:hypothetical protein